MFCNVCASIVIISLEAFSPSENTPLETFPMNSCRVSRCFVGLQVTKHSIQSYYKRGQCQSLLKWSGSTEFFSKENISNKDYFK
ncbi:unnamed protein product [Larinioides sclopetarius]|uniref:Secreted protein n=1 Tax=Larinioides sclopetarius TaxID=280406 RepID=A0AAV1YSY2_9ARAC